MAVSFLTRLQQTINTALSSEPPVSPTTSTSNLPKPTQETPTKSSCWLLDPESSTPTPPGHLPAERGRSLATPNGSSLGTSRTSGDTLPVHLDARLYMDQQDMFSPSDRTITQATGSTSRGSVDRDPIVLGGNLPPGSVGLRGVEGTDSTPSTATVKRFERPEEDEVEAETKRRRRKRGVNEVSGVEKSRFLPTEPSRTWSSDVVVGYADLDGVLLGMSDLGDRQAASHERVEKVDELADPAGTRC